jgi:hypothetical protein
LRGFCGGEGVDIINGNVCHDDQAGLVAAGVVVRAGVVGALLPNGGGGVAGVEARGLEKCGDSLFDPPHFPSPVELAVFRAGTSRLGDGGHRHSMADDRVAGVCLPPLRQTGIHNDGALSGMGVFCGFVERDAMGAQWRGVTSLINPCASFRRRRLPTSAHRGKRCEVASRIERRAGQWARAHRCRNR